MATPTNPLESFIWGQGGVAKTPEQIARERKIAQALMNQGVDFSPVAHPLQGLARVATAGAGAFRDWRAGRAENAAAAENSSLLSDLFSGSGGATGGLPGGFPAAPSAPGVTGGVPAAATDYSNIAAATGGSSDFDTIAPTVISRLSQDFNLTPEQAAGVVGQLGHESSGLQAINEVSPLVPGSRGGFGWAQWTGPRRRQFEAFAQERGLNVTDPEANYQFLAHELRNTPEGSVLASLREAPDAQTAGRVFTDKFLRPGIPGYDSRAKWTNRALTAYQSSIANGATPAQAAIEAQAADPAALVQNNAAAQYIGQPFTGQPLSEEERAARRAELQPVIDQIGVPYSPPQTPEMAALSQIAPQPDAAAEIQRMMADPNAGAQPGMVIDPAQLQLGSPPDASPYSGPGQVIDPRDIPMLANRQVPVAESEAEIQALEAQMAQQDPAAFSPLGQQALMNAPVQGGLQPEMMDPALMGAPQGARPAPAPQPAGAQIAQALGGAADPTLPMAGSTANLQAGGIPATRISRERMAQILGNRSIPESTKKVALGMFQQEQTQLNEELERRRAIQQRYQAADALGIDPALVQNDEAFKAAVQRATRDRQTATVGNVVIDTQTGEPIYTGAQQPTAEIQNLDYRAREAGLVPGSPEYQQFMQRGGAASGDSAAIERIDRMTENLMSTGDFVDPQEARNIAVGIVDGRLRADRHPVTGELQVVDMATGRPAYQRPVGESGGGTLPAPADPMSAPDQFGRQFPATQESFGVPGAIAGGINRVTDALGMGAAYPEVQQTQADFGILRENLLNDIASAYNRQPPSWLLKEIRDLTPSAGSPFEGVGGAQAKMNAIGRNLANELAATEQALQRDLSPTNRQELEARRSGLQMGLQRVSGALQSFGASPQAEGGPQPGAIEDGYRFMGGDPASPDSWERVQ